VDAGARYVKSWYSQWIGESLVLELRTSVFRHVQRQSLAFFTRTQTGSLVSRMDEDIGETQRLVGVLMSESVSAPLNLVLVLAVMFWLSWQLSLVALAVVPLFVRPGKVAARRAQRLFLQQMQLHGELAAMMAGRSDVSGALLAKLYGRPEEEAALFTRKAARIRDLAVASAAGVQLVLSFITLLAALVTALVYGLGGRADVAGHRAPAVHRPGGGPDPRRRRRADRRTRDTWRAARRGRGVRGAVPDPVRAAGSIMRNPIETRQLTRGCQT